MSLAIRWGRHSTLFTAGSFSVVAMGLLSVVVFTRYLSPSQFGELAVLLIFAALLTVLYNLGSLQGTLMVTYGAGEEDADEGQRPGSIEVSRKGLGTGLLLTTAIALIGTATIAATSPSLARLLLGEVSHSDAVVLAAASGGLGAVWRLVVNVVRLERRPALYSALNSIRPILVVAAAIPFLVVGQTITGVLSGMLIGSGVSVVLVLIVIRRSLSLSFDTDVLRRLLVLGGAYVPIIAGYWTIQNVDLFLLSRVASDADVGFYRLASRLGALGSYGIAGFLTAWIPLQGTAAFIAVDEEHGRQAVRSRIVTSFVLVGSWLIVCFTATAGALVKIAPDAYSPAAPLVPLLAGGFVLQGVMMTLYRSSAFKHRRSRYRWIVVGCAVLFLAICFPLASTWGPVGAALAVIASFSVGAATLWALSQRGPNPLAIPYRRLAVALVIAAAFVVLIEATDDAHAWLRVVVGLASIVGYPLALLMTGVVTSSDVRRLGRIGGALLPRRHSTRRWGEELRKLGLADLKALRAATGKRDRDRVDQRQATWTSALHRLTNTEARLDTDERLAGYLRSDRSRVAQDSAASDLYRDGLGPSQLTVFETAFADLRHLPRRTWDRAELEASVALRDRLAAVETNDAWWLELVVRHAWAPEQVGRAFRVPIGTVHASLARTVGMLEPELTAEINQESVVSMLRTSALPDGAKSMILDDLLRAPEGVWPVGDAAGLARTRRSVWRQRAPRSTAHANRWRRVGHRAAVDSRARKKEP